MIEHIIIKNCQFDLKKSLTTRMQLQAQTQLYDFPLDLFLQLFIVLYLLLVAKHKSSKTSLLYYDILVL